jgi:hypothetical protein
LSGLFLPKLLRFCQMNFDLPELDPTLQPRNLEPNTDLALPRHYESRTYYVVLLDIRNYSRVRGEGTALKCGPEGED